MSDPSKKFYHKYKDDAVGYRSPYVSLYQGAMSPSSTQGRSVREYEDQVAALKKENFNLKLRLFFIEESIPGFHSSGQDNNELLMKQIIDLKVELEILRKEVQEKQDLLKDAAQAMNQMEKIQQESELKNQSVIDDLKERISYLETQEAVPKHSDKKINDLLLEKDEVIREYEEKVKELAIFNNELIDDVEKKENENAEKEITIAEFKNELDNARAETEKLMVKHNAEQEKYEEELVYMKLCEDKLRKCQIRMEQMQRVLAIKTDSAVLLARRLQEYESMVVATNLENYEAKKENRFFKKMIDKIENNRETRIAIETEMKQRFNVIHFQDWGPVLYNKKLCKPCTHCVQEKCRKNKGHSCKTKTKRHNSEHYGNHEKHQRNDRNVPKFKYGNGNNSHSLSPTRSCSSTQTNYSTPTFRDYGKVSGCFIWYSTIVTCAGLLCRQMLYTFL